MFSCLITALIKLLCRSKILKFARKLFHEIILNISLNIKCKMKTAVPHKKSLNLGKPFSQGHFFMAATTFPREPVAKGC